MNPWYAFTYEALLDLADWVTFDADVAKKIVGIYSWMPQTIMKLRMPGNRFMCDAYSLQHVTEAAVQTAPNLVAFNGVSLQDLNLEECSEEIESILAPLFGVLGSVAASKYFHFSRPFLFPMWDATLRKEAQLANSPMGFVQYMRLFQQELLIQENADAAALRYPANLIRGWDIVRMANRNA
jgi:hypothetical protein